MIEILSVKNDVSNGDTYCIKYIEVLKDGYKRVMTMDSPEPARPEFDMALAHMAQDFCDLAMLVPKDTKKRDGPHGKSQDLYGGSKPWTEIDQVFPDSEDLQSHDL